MANPTVIKLQDGNVMPQLGLGVWQASNEEVITAIQKALDVGYRSIDTAAAYKNEEGVGKALKNASVNREELFITTKLWNDDHKRPREALLDSLKKLQLDYIDLYLMHWPVPAIDHYVEAWKGMIELQKEGLIKSIGVCNFQIHHLQRLIDETGVTPVINQIELHPLMQQRQLHAWNATHKIQTESWSPLAQGGKGVFDQKVIRDLADKYDALVMVDDSHAVGFVGENGRGSHEYCDVMGRVDIITGTLGKALGGASGGYTAARKEVVEWLRQRSRPYLFSNSLAPAIVAASIKVLEMVEAGSELRDRLWANARQFREQMSAAGFTLAGADHAIIPVMLGDAVVAQKFARELQKEGIYVTGFFYPVVPKGQARIRTQMSAAHTPEQITRAVEAFTRIGKQLGVIA